MGRGGWTGRHLRGRKLTIWDAVAIRRRWAGRVTRGRLAEEYGISERMVAAILAGERWGKAGQYRKGIRLG
jgi:hypothetical protein